MKEQEAHFFFFFFLFLFFFIFCVLYFMALSVTACVFIFLSPYVVTSARTGALPICLTTPSRTQSGKLTMRAANSLRMSVTSCAIKPWNEKNGAWWRKKKLAAEVSFYMRFFFFFNFIPHIFCIIQSCRYRYP